MNDIESTAHHLVTRLRYLLSRLQDKFFHVHPDFCLNGSTISLAFSSILNEALNLQEAVFHDVGANFWASIKKWSLSQMWAWEDINIRFTWWPVLEDLHPFQLDQNDKLTIIGRDSNNALKHKGELATLSATIYACATAWFLVLEKAREAKIYLSTSDIDKLMSIFDCYELIGFLPDQYGNAVSHPLINRIEYPMVRGFSEVPLAKAAYEQRYSRWKNN